MYCVAGQEETEAFSQLDMPLITFERSIAGDIPFVGCDNYQGGQLATEHLYGKGCRILAHIGGTIEVPMPADAQAARIFGHLCAVRFAGDGL